MFGIKRRNIDGNYGVNPKIADKIRKDQTEALKRSSELEGRAFGDVDFLLRGGANTPRYIKEMGDRELVDAIRVGIDRMSNAVDHLAHERGEGLVEHPDLLRIAEGLQVLSRAGLVEEK